MKGLGAWAVFATVLLAFAGCMGQGPPPVDYAAVEARVDAAAARVLRLDHGAAAGHSDAALHQGASNVELVGYSNGVDDSGDPNTLPPRATFNEIALGASHAYLVGQSSDGSFGGFSILDVSAPAQPRVVSRFPAQGGADIEIDPEETLAFLSTQRSTPQQVLGGVVAQGTPAAALARGVYVVDIADKAAPRLDSFLPLPYNGPHTMTYHRHANGHDYLLACTYDLVTDPLTGGLAGAVPVTQRLVVFLVAPNPATPGGAPGPKVALLPVAQFQIAELPPPGKLYFPHDASVQVHPFQDGKTLIHLAYWDKGLRILDFSDPPAPSPDGVQPPTLREVGSFTEFAPSAYNNIHFAKAFDMPLLARGPDGTPREVHVTVTEPEIVTAPDETGQITFLDTTDPSHPAALGHWTLPEQDPPLGVSGLDFSPHNFDLWDGKVALGHNHAGVWVLDVSSPDLLEDPAEVGFYMTAKPRKGSPTLQPRVWGVLEQGGLLYASDEATGLYVLRYTGP